MSATRHDVLIVGGGNAGISLAARLRRDGAQDVAIIDPRVLHHYRPLLNYVGGGQATMSDLQKPQRDVIPRGVRWYQDSVASVDPVERVVRTESGELIGGRDLVICPGVLPDWDTVPGGQEAVMGPYGCSNYVDERAPQTWEQTRALRSGSAVFVVDAGLVPCSGAALKPLYLSTDHWRKEGVLGDIDVTLVVGWPTIFGIPHVDEQLQRAADDLGITVVTGALLHEVDPQKRRLTYERDGSAYDLDYDMLHLVPRHKPPEWIATSDLAGPGTGGTVEIDPRTHAHRRHPRVWGLGDAADVQASRSGGALRKQAGVVADNIAAQRLGEELVTYNGYTTHPITVSRDTLVLAEFDRDYQLTPSIPVIDLVKPHRLTWFYDLYLQPVTYWRSILKGRVSA